MTSSVDIFSAVRSEEWRGRQSLWQRRVGRGQTGSSPQTALQRKRTGQEERGDGCSRGRRLPSGSMFVLGGALEETSGVLLVTLVRVSSGGKRGLGDYFLNQIIQKFPFPPLGYRHVKRLTEVKRKRFVWHHTCELVDELKAPYSAVFFFFNVLFFSETLGYNGEEVW